MHTSYLIEITLYFQENQIYIIFECSLEHGKKKYIDSLYFKIFNMVVPSLISIARCLII
jgi:hypothetical protein